MIEQLYFVKYKSGEKGCPIYIGGKHLKDGEWTGDHEWDYYSQFKAKVLWLEQIS